MRSSAKMAQLMLRARRSRSGVIGAGGRIFASSGAGSGGKTSAICGTGCCAGLGRLGASFWARTGGFGRRAGDFVRRVIGFVPRACLIFARAGTSAWWPVPSPGRPCGSGCSAVGRGAGVGSGSVGTAETGSGWAVTGPGGSAVTGCTVISSVLSPERDALTGSNAPAEASLVLARREGARDGSLARTMATDGSVSLLLPGTRRGRDVGPSARSGASGRGASSCRDASLLTASSATRMRCTTSSGNAAGPTGLVPCPLPGACRLLPGTRRGRGAGLSSATGRPPGRVENGASLADKRSTQRATNQPEGRVVIRQLPDACVPA
jgi:hypothetical protein